MQFLLETISRYRKDKKVTGNSHIGLIKYKLCLTNLPAFFNEMTGSVDVGKAMDATYSDFSKAFNSVSQSCGIFIHGDTQNFVGQGPTQLELTSTLALL